MKYLRLVLENGQRKLPNLDVWLYSNCRKGFLSRIYQLAFSCFLTSRAMAIPGHRYVPAMSKTISSHSKKRKLIRWTKFPNSKYFFLSIYVYYSIKTVT